MRKYAALTMARDETDYLKLWHRYYAKEFGAENLFIIDHNSEHFRPCDVIGEECNSFKLPIDNPLADPDGKKHHFDQIRFKAISAQINALLHYYDCVVFNDADEFFFVDGKMGLRDYLDSLPEIGNRCGFGVDIMHHIKAERPFDVDRPLFQQRRFFRYNVNYSKPWIVAKPTEIRGHGALTPFQIDANLLMCHLRWFDYDIAERTHKLRQAAFAQGRGGRKSRWSVTMDSLDVRFNNSAKLKPQRTRIGQMPHRAALDELFPDHENKLLSDENYQRMWDNGENLITLIKFMTKEDRDRIGAPLYFLPEGFKSSGV